MLGFSEECGQWKCTECGYVNKIDDSEVYFSEEERLSALQDPYNGMSDEDVIALMSSGKITSTVNARFCIFYF